jgi:hypothetical protein
MTDHWRNTDRIAWTERDGAGRAPWSPGPAAWLATGTALTAVLGVILFSDTLCPEHRAWVQVMGVVSILAAGTSLAGIVRHSTWAPIGTIAAACGGVAIGLIDAVHAPGRGWLIAVLFAGVAVGAALLAGRQLALARWERTVVAPLLAAPPSPAGPDEHRASPAPEPAAAPEPASSPVADPSHAG